MLQQPVAIHYQDGRSEETTITQYELGEFEKWCRKAGYTPSRPGAAFVQDMPILYLRFGAWCGLHRSVSIKSNFDTWNNTVIEVEPIGSGSPDPTEMDTQEEPSLE